MSKMQQVYTLRGFLHALSSHAHLSGVTPAVRFREVGCLVSNAGLESTRCMAHQDRSFAWRRGCIRRCIAAFREGLKREGMERRRQIAVQDMPRGNVPGSMEQRRR
ncbi:hypothetical protein AcW1_001548 [Taiwanofungus camphoratus]|nr:hypothetical protein AcW1_001548 [Antrodia cinnamomea]